MPTRRQGGNSLAGRGLARRGVPGHAGSVRAPAEADRKSCSPDPAGRLTEGC